MDCSTQQNTDISLLQFIWIVITKNDPLLLEMWFQLKGVMFEIVGLLYKLIEPGFSLGSEIAIKDKVKDEINCQHDINQGIA